MIERPQTSEREVLVFLESLEAKIKRRLKQHGLGIAVSPAEVYGIVAEEFHELMIAMHGNDEEEFYKELEDIAIAAVFGMVSIHHRRKSPTKKVLS
jgi:hypothetical protein